MNDNMKKEWIWRLLIYTAGMVVLAAGITLNTKTGLGVSPIISIPFTISTIWHTDFGMTTFVIYFIFVGIQLALKGKNWLILLQAPISFVFSMLLNVFGDLLDIKYDSLWQNLLLLLAAIVVTALGVVMTVNMKLVPNPADGLAQTVGEVLHRGVGFGKNVIDFTSVGISLVLGLAIAGRLEAIGIGTVIAMVGVGRFIALFNYFWKERLDRLAGLLPQEAQMEGPVDMEGTLDSEWRKIR